MKIKSMLLFNILWFFLLGLGCTGRGQQLALPSTSLLQPPSEIWSTPAERPQITDSSLWRESTASGYLFIDPKARTVGDIVTINIIEKASAKGNASTKAGKKTSLAADISSFLGLEKSISKGNANIDPTKLLNASTDNTFDSSGEISRSGKITATITARVIQVLPNRNLVIRGTRQVTINNEQQLLIIQGIIRPEDITPQNTITSTSIADAQIIYTGKGVVSDKQAPGWLSRIVDRIWPF